MTPQERRQASLLLATNHAHAIGLACPVCIIEIANTFDGYVETGLVPKTGHLGEAPSVEEVDEPASDDNVTPFPKKPH